MSKPRQIVAGRYWLLTRRCTQGLCLLRPDLQTNEIFDYCLADAARRSGVQVVGYQALSNHYHAVVHDPEARLPEFMEHLNKFAARALNVHWQRKENVWSTDPTCATHLVNPSDVMAKLLYTLANAVAADLVDHVADWPGANSYSAMLSGEPIQTMRPVVFFRKNGPMPEAVSLVLVRPPGYEKLSQEEWANYLREQVRIVEDRTRAERVKKGKSVLGRLGVLRTSPTEASKTQFPRGKIHPEVACKETDARVNALLGLKAFRAAHEEARLQLKANVLEVVFPYGTYKMRIMGHPCAAPP